MSPPSVAAFTDTYLPTVNGVTYTVSGWRERWARRGGRMDVVYPASDHVPESGEYPVPSVPFPFYDGYLLGTPAVPDVVRTVDLVHAHTPFGLGIGGLRLARSEDLPLVASYHTPTAEYAGYISEGPLARAVARVGDAYERWFLSRADHVVAPSPSARAELAGVSAPVTVVPNGVDVDRFAPTDATDFRERHGLPDGRLVGYTGRHGFEKRLHEVIDACEGLDVTVVFGGDGPARENLEARAAERNVDVRFLGFLEREEMPAFYSALSTFAFPSPVETQGLVALEANACGTPVAAANSGALVDTVEDGVNGYHYPSGDVAAFRTCIARCLDEYETLRERCLDRRDAISVEHAVDALATVYDDVL